MTEAMVPAVLLEAQAHEHRVELAKRDMQLVRYRLLLEQHGIEPPDSDGEELLQMWRDCRTVITTASEFTMRLGTSKELLTDWSADARR
jgi:hypothetical protein